MKRYNIAVIGAGHVGLVVAAGFADLGHKVYCLDNDSKRIQGLKKGQMPFYEPGLEDLVKKNSKNGRLIFSASLAEGIEQSEVIFLAVGTPPMPDGSADLTAVENVACEIAKNLKSYKLVVSKSTVPVHTGQRAKETIYRYRKGDNAFDVASNPEFLREGKAVYDFFYPDRIVIGVESERAEMILKEIYAPLQSEIVVTDINTAELIKHASNSFLAMKISFINAVSRICDLAKADINKIAYAMGMDKRIGKDFLQAGVGYGGFCFPKDVEAFVYISSKLGYDFNLLKEVSNVNKDQPLYFVDKIKEHLWILKDKKIAILGLAFKPDTDDMRFAPAIEVVNSLLKSGAIVSLYDPQAMKEAASIFPIVSDNKNSKKKLLKLNKRGCFLAKNPYEAIENADCICFLTEWQEFKGLDFKKIKDKVRYPLIADGRNMFDKSMLMNMGFQYIGMGR